MIENILNKMKIEMKFSITKQTSILSVERNYTNVKTASQDCPVTRATSVERILPNQKEREGSVTISCHSLSQKVSIKKN
jgi:hypothetical protein